VIRAIGFQSAPAECQHCGSESPEMALTSEEHEAFESMLCRACGKRCIHHEEASEAIEAD
jgi:hypothetical protein